MLHRHRGGVICKPNCRRVAGVHPAAEALAEGPYSRAMSHPAGERDLGLIIGLTVAFTCAATCLCLLCRKLSWPRKPAASTHPDANRLNKTNVQHDPRQYPAQPLTIDPTLANDPQLQIDKTGSPNKFLRPISPAVARGSPSRMSPSAPWREARQSRYLSQRDESVVQSV